ncbi:Putative mitochondrial protein [Durusdinium trenchii]|uniref:Mitochondrial protein n=1 Tax=Durusdinium trenchii TaxID=1381693 RepID=A0ABP0MUC9_9DINO
MTITTEVAEAVEKHIKSMQDGQLHHGCKELINVLKKANLAWEAQLPANQIGVHPENRDGCGILVSHVQRLIEELCELGYDSQLTRNICVEIPHDRVPSEDFNIKLADGSGGALAKVAPGTLRFLSLSGGHTNQAIKAIAAGCQHQSAQLTMDGSLSMAKIKEKCPELARVAEQGQMWVVLSSHAISRFPAIPRLVQSAANASTHLAAAESELQLARKVLRAYLSASETKASGVTWLDISSEVLRSKPPHMKVAPAMFKFIMNYAGGKSGHMLSATEAFVNTCGVNKSLGFELWDCISQESKGKSKIPRLLARHAALKLAYLQEDVLVTCADIKKLLAGKELQPEVDKMESIILQIHKMGKGHEGACSGATLVMLSASSCGGASTRSTGAWSGSTRAWRRWVMSLWGASGPHHDCALTDLHTSPFSSASHLGRAWCAMAALPDSPEDDELAMFLQRNVAQQEHSKEEAAEENDAEWKAMGLCKPPKPPEKPQKRMRGLGATKRHNSNQRQNERNLAKQLMNQRHGASRWNASWWTSSSSSWRGWSDRGWSERGWWSQDQDGWGGSSGSTTRLLEKALDKIPDAR